MLVYDVTDAKSLDGAMGWAKNIEENAADDVAKILVGNNCADEERRQVRDDWSIARVDSAAVIMWF